MAEFAAEHPAVHQEWVSTSNTLVVVGVRNEAELLALATTAGCLGITHRLVCEPDYGGVPTALALAPEPAVPRICAQLPLALRKEKAVA